MIIDNAAVHDKEQLMDLVQSVGARVIFLPPYSPDYNPIELVFGNVKRKLRDLNYGGGDFTHPEGVVNDAFSCVGREKVQSFIRSCGYTCPPRRPARFN